MYQCLNCGEHFSFPLLDREVHYECDEHPYELIYLCPYCEDMDIKKEETEN